MKMLYDTIAEYISGDWGEESRSPTSTQPAFCIRAADVVPIEANDFSTIPERFVSSSSFSQRQLREGDIVIEKSGGSPTQSTGRVVYISKPLLIAKQNVICSNFCTAIRLKPNWNPYFVYQYWRHIYNSGVFFNYEGKTSGLKNLQLEVALKSIPIPDIDLPTQLRIAGVLGSLDKKIALNRKKIAELEALAKTIYDYWFVQFDFPDKNGKPYKSSGGKMVWNEQLKREVPDGWEVTQIGKHIKSNRGVSYSTKNISSGRGIPMINLNSFNVASTYKVAGIKTFEGEVPNSKLLKPFDLVMCNTQQTDLDPKKDIIGKSFLVPDIFNLDITSSHHVTTIHVDDDALKVFLNALFHTNEFHAYISGFASGTSIRGLDFFGVESCYVVMPPKPLLSKFAQLVMACEKQKSIVLKDQSLLQPLRDYLLPLLMNGQVTIGDLK